MFSNWMRRRPGCRPSRTLIFHAEPALHHGVAKWLDELAWREYDVLVRNDDPKGFEAGCE